MRAPSRLPRLLRFHNIRLNSSPRTVRTPLISPGSSASSRAYSSTSSSSSISTPASPSAPPRRDLPLHRIQAAMASAHTLPIRRIQPSELASILLSAPATPETPSSLAIIDVRDSDHVGGHILGSVHTPSSSLSYTAPELVRKLQGKKKVVFHCMLSQERGPNAARKYLITRERMGFGVGLHGEEGEEKKEEEEKKDGEGEGQEVLVLEGGFVEWGKLYGKDKRLTEGYVEELWEGGW